MGSQEFRLRRRGVLALAGGSMAAIAGCSVGDSGPNDGGSSPVNNPSSTGTESPSTTTNPDTSRKEPTQTTATVEDITNEYESKIEESLSDMGNWIETKETMLQIPDWAKDDKEDRWTKDEGVVGYRRLVHIFMGPRPPSKGTPIENHVAASDEIEDGEFDSDSPYRLVAVLTRIKEVDDQFLSSYNGVPVESKAVERFLQENVHGVIDHGQQTSQRLLDYARQ